jgi:hypothetical protein
MRWASQFALAADGGAFWISASKVAPPDVTSRRGKGEGAINGASRSRSPFLNGDFPFLHSPLLETSIYSTDVSTRTIGSFPSLRPQKEFCILRGLLILPRVSKEPTNPSSYFRAPTTAHLSEQTLPRLCHCASSSLVDIASRNSESPQPTSQISRPIFPFSSS